MSKFLNISTDTTLGGNSASDDTVASQKAVKSYVDSQTGTAPAFANITGQPTDNANLATALAGKVPTSRTINSKALTSDITLTASDVGALPDSTVIPTVNNATLTIQKNGTTVNTFTANASSNVTANITVPTKTSDLTNDDGFITGITSSDVTTALGYTPYDSSNPSGYTSNVGTVTSVNNVSPVNGNVTLSIPAAQIQSDWTQSDNTKLDYIKNKPNLATVATTGAYSDLSGTPTIPTVNDATLTITQGGTTKGTFTANASSNVTIDLDSGGGLSRNVGEIVQSTIPLTDAGLHLLDGSVIQRGSYADFVDYIAGLVSTYPDLFTTEANWQTAVTTYGVCGKFVYDSVNNTVRLPKITGFIEGTTDVTALGDLIEAGLPNITGGFQAYSYNVGDATGAISSSIQASNQLQYGSGSGLNYVTFNLDASGSSSIYGNSTTVQPQTIKVLYYIVVATSTKTQIEVDIDEVMTDLNGKADVDLSNMNPTQTVKNTIVGWGMPDYSAGIDISSGNISSVYGWFYISGHSYSSTPTVSLNDSVVYTGGYSGSERLSNTCILFVKPNDKISWNGWNAQVSMARIYPCIGVN